MYKKCGSGKKALVERISKTKTRQTWKINFIRTKKISLKVNRQRGHAHSERRK